MNNWLLFFLNRSIRRRRGRFLLAAAAVMLTVTSVTVLATISAGIRERIEMQIRQYGANMLVTSADGAVINDAVALRVPTLSPAIQSASFEIYGTVMLDSAAVEVIGRDLDRMTGVRIEGALPGNTDEFMAGVRLRDSLGLKSGELISPSGIGKAFKVTAFFERGTDEDGTLLMPLAVARSMLGRKGVNAVLLNVDTARLDEFERVVRESEPLLQTRRLMQVAVAEERLLAKIRLLLMLVTLVVLVASVIALGSTMGANVLERMEEIGLMTSLGALPGQIVKFFFVEAAAAGLAGSLAGYAAGVLAAEAVALTAFGGFISVDLVSAPIALVLGTVLATVTAYFPVRDALSITPATILRGE